MNAWKVSLLAALMVAITPVAGAQERPRLLVEVLPMYVTLGDPPGPVNYNIRILPPRKWPPLRETFAMTHEAMNMLGVAEHEYDIERSPLGRLTMRCLGTKPNAFLSNCDPNWPNVDRDDAAAPSDRFPPPELPLSERPTGTMLLIVLVLPLEFEFNVGNYRGQAQHRIASDGHYHWAKSRCVTWSVPSPNVIAHELGHCAGLDHNGDDEVFDLMRVGTGASTRPNHLNPSNQQHIREFFRDMPEVATPKSAPATSAEPRCVHVSVQGSRRTVIPTPC